MKKQSLFIGIGLFILLCSGCGDEKGNIQSAGEEERQEKVVISMMAPSGELFDVDRYLMAKYEEYSGNQIDFQEVPDDQYANVLKAKLASGQGPDIAVIWPGENAAQFYPERFLDLSGEQWVSELTEDAVENQTFDRRMIGFGLEGGNSGWGILYNKSIFEESGAQIPENMEDFLEICEKIHMKGYTPLAGTFKEEWTSGIWMALMGSKASMEKKDYYEELNSNQSDFSDNQVYLEFIRDYKKIYDRGYLGKKAFDSTARDAFLQVFEGEAAMALSNCTPEVWLADSDYHVEEKDFGMFPAPFADNRTVTRYKGGLIRVVNKKSRHIEECREYLDFLAEKENLEIYYSSPERKAINPSFQDFQKEKETGVFEKQLLEHSQGDAVEIGESSIMFWDNTFYGRYVNQAVLGLITPEEALKSMDDYRHKMFMAKENPIHKGERHETQNDTGADF